MCHKTGGHLIRPHQPFNRDRKDCDPSKWIEKSREPTSFLRVVILMLSHSVPNAFRDHKDCDPSKTYEGPPDFFVLSFLCCLVLVHKTLGVHNSNLTSKWIDKLRGLISLSHIVVLMQPYTIRKTFRVHNPSSPSKQMDKLRGLPIFSVSSLWYYHIWYTSLVTS